MWAFNEENVGSKVRQYWEFLALRSPHKKKKKRERKKEKAK